MKVETNIDQVEGGVRCEEDGVRLEVKSRARCRS
jgi:hypothetical protein